MTKKTKEVKLTSRKLSNGKYYVKLNNEYIGTCTKEQLDIITKEVTKWKNTLPTNQLQTMYREIYVRTEQETTENQYKQYNKKLPVETINKIKRLSKHYGVTENEMITKAIDDYYATAY